MERRDWSLKALEELIYADSLGADDKAASLIRWYEKYLSDNSVEVFDLELEDLKKLDELFFKSINFLKKHKEDTRLELQRLDKMKKFLKN